VIVGSGFGGSVMAHRLAGAGLRTCLLERGKAWPPGSFPRSPLAFQQEALWDPAEGKHGFFDVWSFRGLGALVSSGLGGGSLIYANVILPKDEWSFVEETVVDGPRAWPVTYADLEPHYAAVHEMLAPVAYPDHLAATTPKTVAFRTAAAGAGLEEVAPTPLAVTFPDPGEEPGVAFGNPADNLHNSQRYKCRLVGECDAGCNYGSKNSLDFNYLSTARTSGADIRCRHEVKAFEPHNGGYRIEYVDYTDAIEGRPPDVAPERKTMYARRLILSAGALGTPYLLLANRSALAAISHRLGTRFSGNGDFLAFAKGIREPVDQTRGPVITTAVRTPTYYMEDAGYGAFVAWIGEMLQMPRLAWAARSVGLKLLWRWLIGNQERNLSYELSQLLGDPRTIAGSLVMLGMGREEPQGRLSLHDGKLDVAWSFRRARPYFEMLREGAAAIAEQLGGRLEDNILWRLNAVMTVHPLGGCPLGRTVDEGVVDPMRGEVFNYPGLHVADGSVMPGPVGANPSFTIAALADRFADGILAAEGLQ
jgi:cholesterol oxidase